MAKEAVRYVELTFELPDDEETHFRAVMTRAISPNDALREAINDTRKAHPVATKIDEFMQRKVTEEKAIDIVTAMNDGKWGGWSFTRSEE